MSATWEALHSLFISVTPKKEESGGSPVSSSSFKFQRKKPVITYISNNRKIKCDGVEFLQHVYMVGTANK